MNLIHEKVKCMNNIHRPSKPKKDDLVKLYDVCNSIFKSKKCFYTNEEFKKEKEKKVEV